LFIVPSPLWSWEWYFRFLSSWTSHKGLVDLDAWSLRCQVKWISCLIIKTRSRCFNFTCSFPRLLWMRSLPWCF
jgi:hypothetical protein